MHHTQRHDRFIPACAGNTLCNKRTARKVSVHPRVCGEHFNSSSAGGNNYGSSPRVRGTQLFHRLRFLDIRFIPACAGNTSGSARRPRFRPVHPRVCGEHQGRRRQGRAGHGSSPRVRGTRAARGAIGPHVRFIPACAGNTGTARLIFQRIPVHPRVCGEHVVAVERKRGSAGSSPRVRGTPMTVSPAINILRFIPACAGNTPSVTSEMVSITVHPRVCGEHGDLKRS